MKIQVVEEGRGPTLASTGTTTSTSTTRRRGIRRWLMPRLSPPAVGNTYCGRSRVVIFTVHTAAVPRGSHVLREIQFAASHPFPLVPPFTHPLDTHTHTYLLFFFFFFPCPFIVPFFFFFFSFWGGGSFSSSLEERGDPCSREASTDEYKRSAEEETGFR